MKENETAPEFVYAQEEKLDLATIRRWRSDAITAYAQDRLWLNRVEALCDQLLRTGAFDE